MSDDPESRRRARRQRRNHLEGRTDANMAPNTSASTSTQANGSSSSPPTRNTFDLSIPLPTRTSSTLETPKSPSPSLFATMLTKSHLPSQGVFKRASEAPVFGKTTFTIIAGLEDNQSLFSVHETLARKESEFIEAAFRRGWKESEDRIIYLPEHEPEHFQLFFNFIYARAIFSTQDSPFDNEKGTVGDPEWTRLVNAWALGNYLQAVDFKDAVIDAIIQKVVRCGATAPQSMHQIVYPKSTNGALIRRLAVDIAAYRWDAFYLKIQKNEAAWSDFFLDLSIALSEMKGKGSQSKPLFETDPCVYHEHRIHNAPCYKTKFRIV